MLIVFIFILYLSKRYLAIAVCFSKVAMLNAIVEWRTISNRRLGNISTKSKARGDTLHTQLQERSAEEKGRLKCHINCISSYTSNHHIKRYLDRTASKKSVDTQESPQKRTRRTDLTRFECEEHCFFCGEACVVITDPKHPDRYRLR